MNHLEVSKNNSGWKYTFLKFLKELDDMPRSASPVASPIISKYNSDLGTLKNFKTQSEQEWYNLDIGSSALALVETSRTLAEVSDSTEARKALAISNILAALSVKDSKHSKEHLKLALEVLEKEITGSSEHLSDHQGVELPEILLRAYQLYSQSDIKNDEVTEAKFIKTLAKLPIKEQTEYKKLRWQGHHVWTEAKIQTAVRLDLEDKRRNEIASLLGVKKISLATMIKNQRSARGSSPEFFPKPYQSIERETNGESNENVLNSTKKQKARLPYEGNEEEILHVRKDEAILRNASLRNSKSFCSETIGDPKIMALIGSLLMVPWLVMLVVKPEDDLFPGVGPIVMYMSWVGFCAILVGFTAFIYRVILKIFPEKTDKAYQILMFAIFGGLFVIYLVFFL